MLSPLIGTGPSFWLPRQGATSAARVDFLFNDWLWLIDPTNKRPPGW